MKKITESDLKSAVGSLQKYMQEAGYMTPAMLAARTNQQAAGGYTDPAAVDKEIARFSAGNDMKLQANRDYVANLEKKKAAVLAASGKQTTANAAPAATTKPTVPHKTGGVPEAWVKELQTKLNAAGEKLTVDGVMGPATRKAQERHPEITTQPADAAAVGADINKGETGPAVVPPAPTPAPTTPAYNPNNPHVPKPDTTRQDAWEKLTPEDQKAIGQADPTDPYILMRLPNKGRPAAPANESSELVGFRNDESLTRILAITGRVLR